MIVTRSWLNEWIELNNIPTGELIKTFNSIGLEVDSIHSYDVPKKIVFGRVVECKKHPEADKLSVCIVDIGTSTRQIVCGASNVRTGLDVVVATVGAVMPDGLIIKPVKLRGIESEGMICSAKEIGLPEIGEGIMELDESIGNYTIGQEVCESPVFSDDVIEIELTANRGDCLSIRGIARDLSAAYDKSLKEEKHEENDEKRVGIGRILTLSHENNLHVNLRYKAVDVKELRLPFIVRLRLSQIDVSRETDIESLMHYATHSSGVILRAYNFDFFRKENETMAKISLCNDENSFACIMAKDKTKASVVGIIQEDASKVSYNEGIILVEASYIPPDIISKKMQAKKIASGPMYYRTSRGSEPDLDIGLCYCTNMIESNSSSSVFGGTIELGDPQEDKIISVSKKEIDEIIGASIDKARITKILKNLGFDTTKSSANNFVISVPRFRHDISNKQDIVEEIVRLVGIDNIPSKPFAFTEANRLEDDYFRYKKRRTYRQKAANNGFFESVHFVFEEKKTLQKYGFKTVCDEKELLNPIVNTLDTLRTTLLTTMLKSASSNSKAGFSSIRLFEVGSVFNEQREESLRMALLFCGDREYDKISNAGKPQKADFAFFVQKLSNVFGPLELREHKSEHSLSHPYQCACIVMDGNIIGELFRVHPDVEAEYDLDVSYICEVDFEKLPFSLKKADRSSVYQASYRDLSILAPKDLGYESIKEVIKALDVEEIVRFYPVDRYSDESLGDNVSLTVRFMLQSMNKTLEEDDITSAMQSVLNALGERLGIKIR